jgi:superfamily II DNA or RNA helicase
LLLSFKKVKGLNAKTLGSLYLFKGKVYKAKREDFKSNGFISSVDIFVISSPLKHEARKAFKKFLKKKLKIKAVELLAFNRAKR